MSHSTLVSRLWTQLYRIEQGFSVSNFSRVDWDSSNLLRCETTDPWPTDFDSDGADFLAWQRGYSSTGATKSDGDANGDGTVNAVDLGVWQSQLGSSAAPQIATVVNSTPPAPVAATVDTSSLVSIAALEFGSAVDEPDAEVYDTAFAVLVAGESDNWSAGEVVSRPAELSPREGAFATLESREAPEIAELEDVLGDLAEELLAMSQPA